MIALARGPGSAVLISGALVIVLTPGLLPLPAGAGGAVLEKHPSFEQPVANPVGLPEIATAARRVPFFDRPLDLLDRNRRLLVLRAAEAQDPQHTIEAVE